MRLHTDDPLKQQAHQLLDELRAGVKHSDLAVNIALVTLGEPVNETL